MIELPENLSAVLYTNMDNLTYTKHRCSAVEDFPYFNVLWF